MTKQLAGEVCLLSPAILKGLDGESLKKLLDGELPVKKAAVYHRVKGDHNHTYHELKNSEPPADHAPAIEFREAPEDTRLAREIDSILAGKETTGDTRKS